MATKPKDPPVALATGHKTEVKAPALARASEPNRASQYDREGNLKSKAYEEEKRAKARKDSGKAFVSGAMDAASLGGPTLAAKGIVKAATSGPGRRLITGVAKRVISGAGRVARAANKKGATRAVAAGKRASATNARVQAVAKAEAETAGSMAGKTASTPKPRPVPRTSPSARKADISKSDWQRRPGQRIKPINDPGTQPSVKKGLPSTKVKPHYSGAKDLKPGDISDDLVKSYNKANRTPKKPLARTTVERRAPREPLSKAAQDKLDRGNKIVRERMARNKKLIEEKNARGAKEAVKGMKPPTEFHRAKPKPPIKRIKPKPKELPIPPRPPRDKRDKPKKK